MNRRKIVVTGGAGFIGSAVVRHLVLDLGADVCTIDKLTYAGNLSSLQAVEGSERHRFAELDVCDRRGVEALLREVQPDAVMHLAAESHVDRSIDGPAEFIQTNIVGTYSMLEAARSYWAELEPERQAAFRFHHISTDEVFGSLGSTGLFTEASPYDPRSPYSASKAASDHLAKAWHHTYGLPLLVTNCSNNYGPYQFPEKLIPLTILNAIEGSPLPVYGRGDNVRDWLYVEDHTQALALIVAEGRPGETYSIGGDSQRTNLQVVETICEILDELRPRPKARYRDLITFVEDRPGHDKRYAIDASKVQRELQWAPRETFDTGIRKTITWYLENEWWWKPIREKTYGGERLGKA